MKKVFVIFLVIATICITVLTSHAAKTKVAILDFEYGTISDHWWPGNWDIGKGISDMVVTQLVKDGTYSVIERRKLDAVISEQKLGASGLVNANTAAEIGRVLGVKYVIMGSVTQFSIDTKTLGTGGFGRMLGLGGDVGMSTTTATVYIDARMIDTTTAEIVAVAEGRASQSKKGVKVAAGTYQGYGNIALGGEGFEETILGQATRQSVSDVVKQFTAKAGSGGTGESGKTIRTKVADTDIETKTVYIDAGSSEGITVGQTLYILKVKKEIKSPTTGEVIKRVVEAVAEIKVTEVEPSSATATIIKGDIRSIKSGDDVSSTPSL